MTFRRWAYRLLGAFACAVVVTLAVPTNAQGVQMEPRVNMYFVEGSVSIGETIGNTDILRIDVVRGIRTRGELSVEVALGPAFRLLLPPSQTLSSNCGRAEIDEMGDVSWSGFELGIFGQCVLQLAFTIPAGTPPGSYTTGMASVREKLEDGSTSGVLAEAVPATLELTQAAALRVTKRFEPANVFLDGIGTPISTRAIITIDNFFNKDIDATGLAFTDVLPRGLRFADNPGESTNCGSGIATVQGDSLLLANGTANAGMRCNVSVRLVTTDVAGTLINESFPVMSDDLGTVNSEEATLEVERVDGPIVTKQFEPNVLVLDGITPQVTRATVTILSRTVRFSSSDVTFTDILPNGLRVADTPDARTDCLAGELTAMPGAGSFSLANAGVRIRQSCTVGVNLQTTDVAGTLTNESFDVMSNLLGILNTVEAVNLQVDRMDAPSVTKTFSPASIVRGVTTVATITIDNSANTVAATGLAFTDTLPAGLGVANMFNASTDCGSGTATADGRSIALAGGTVAAGMQCTVTVTLRATETGMLRNESFAVASSNLPEATGRRGDAGSDPAAGASHGLRTGRGVRQRDKRHDSHASFYRYKSL